MNLAGRSIILILFLSLLTPALLGQNDASQIIRSKNKVIIAGKIYYIHTVQKGETIYSISKVYGVGQKDLLSENPDLAYGLKEGMNLKIPDRPLPVVDQVFGDTSRFLFHIVSEGQTLYSISRDYHVTVEEITEANPEVKYSNIQPRQVLRIPKKDMAKQESITNKVSVDPNFSLHVVEKGETMFSLSRRYDLKKEDIIRWNGGDAWSGLKAGDTLRIPAARDLDPSIVIVPQKISPPDTVLVSSTEVYDSCNCDSIRNLPLLPEIRVALVLPLNIDDFLMETQDTAMSIDDAGQKFKNSAAPFDEKDMLNQNWTEFYEGFMLALRHTRDSGSSVTLRVFDVGNILHPVFLQTGDIMAFHPDLIVCPLADSSYQILANLAALNHIPIITPVYPAAPISPNPQVISLLPSWQQTITKLAGWLSEEPEVNLVVVHPADTVSQMTISILRSDLPPGMIMKETVFNDTSQADLGLILSSSMTNKVLILSDKEEYVTEIVRSLVLSSHNFNINLIGFSSWAKFRSIAIEDLHNLNLAFLTPYRIDFSTYRVHRFLQQFQAVYGYYPYRTSTIGFNYSMLGYDACTIGFYSMKNYHAAPVCCLNKRELPGLTGPIELGYSGFLSVLQKTNWTVVNYQRDLSVSIHELKERINTTAQDPAFQP